MTLVDILPSLRTSLPPRLTPGIWPSTTRRAGADMLVGDVSISALAEEHGTPFYVIDEADVRERARAFRDAFGGEAVHYSARAFGCRRMISWIADEGLGLSVCSAGEIKLASAAGVPGERITLHGEAKTPADLHAAIDYKVGRVVVESLPEITRLAAEVHAPQKILLRVLLGADSAPGAPGGIPFPADCERFGLSFVDGELDKAITRILGQANLELVGLDCCLGSQVARFGGYERALRQLVDLLAHLNNWYGLELTEVNLGGGFAVAYRDGDPEFAVTAFGDRCRGLMRVECDRHNIPMPRVTVAPGRALVARAGIAVYRVLSIRRDINGHQLVALDGGIADNPRPALYGARYTPMLVGRFGRDGDRWTTLVGRYGEPGDVIARDVPLPGDLRPGDLIAIADAGAYHHSMASNYGLVPRPPVFGVRDGVAQMLVRAETLDEVLARDLV